MQERRVGAYGICVSDGKILVIRKAKGPYKGTFDLPGGGIEFGESPAETVVREVMEETSLHVTVEALAGAFSGVFTFVSDSGERQVELHHLGFLYRVVPNTRTVALKTDPDGLDSLGAEWLAFEDAHPSRVSPLAAHALHLLQV